MNKLVSKIGKKNLTIICIAAVAVIVVAAGIIVGLGRYSDGKKYDSNYDAGLIYYVDGDYSSAIRELNEAMGVDDTEECRLLLARCYAAVGDYDTAISTLNGIKDKSEEVQSLLLEYAALRGDAPDVDDEQLEIGGKKVSPTADSFALVDVTLTDDDMELIASLTKLRTLSLENCGISDISALSALEELESLVLSNNKIEKLSPLTRLTSLRTLYINDNPIEDFSPLFTLTELKTLNISGIEITETQLDELQEALPKCSIHSEEATEVAEEISLGGKTFLSDVTELDLSDLDISDISALAKCTKLEKLNLKGNDVSDLSPLVDLQELKWLSIWDNKVKDLSPLISLSKLEYLDADGNQISRLTALKDLPALRELFVSGNPLTNIDPVLAMTDLEKLGLKNVGLKDADLESIGSKLKSLSTLYIDDNEGLSGNAVETLKAALPSCNITHSDDLIYTVKLGDGEFKTTDTTISAVGMNVSDLSPLAKCTKLTSLHLNSNSISDLTSLATLTGLDVLELDSNSVSDLTPLSGLTKLRVLSLIRNSVTSVEPLGACTALENLYLSYSTNLSDIGALRTCTELTELSLDYTAVFDLSPISELTKLETLSLEGCAELTDVTPLQNFSSLRTLYLTGTSVSEEQITELQLILPNCAIYY